MLHFYSNHHTYADSTHPVTTALYNPNGRTLGHRKQVGRPTDGMLTHVIDPALLLTPYGHRNYLVPSHKLAKTP